MLTNDDLRKIGDLIDLKLEQKLDPIKEDIKILKNNDEIMQKDITVLKKNDKKLRKDLNLILKHFDGERVSHDRRITRIESHLQLLPLE